MQLEKSIILHATEDAKKKWEQKEKPVKQKRSSCPSCEIKNITKDATFVKQELPDDLLDNDYIKR
jgi:hypothetical protein